MSARRVPFDEWAIGVAYAVSQRATCDRKHVGALLVKDKHIISTGYNGSARGLDHCDDSGHMMTNEHCDRTVHAEVNAVSQAARVGTPVKGATAYVTTMPCWKCFILLVNAGVARICFHESYRPDIRVIEGAEFLGIPLEKIDTEEYDALEA